MSASNDDCYFYYYSSCNRGNDCPYRHCEAALGTEIVCSQWKEGLCLRKNCKFRHMESRINRSTIPCYWESQPTGCLKPHCVFLHTKGRGLSDVTALATSKNVILPTGQAQPPQQVLKSMIDDGTKEIGLSPFPFQEPIKSPLLGTPAVPVEPVVVSLNDNEESDSESLNNTPIKANPDSKATSGYQKRLFKDSDDFGIKTLEQLRMEKILKESEHFYKSAYDTPALVPVPKMESQISSVPKNFGSQISDVIEAATVMEDEPACYETSTDNSLLSNDLRDILKRRKGGKPEEMQSSTEEPRKRVISLKRFSSEITDDRHNITVTVNKNKKYEDDCPPPPKSIILMKEKPEVESNLTSKPISVATKEKKNVVDLRFKVKTLDEIRKEKSVKSTVVEVPKDKIIKLTPVAKKEASESISSVVSVRKNDSKVEQTSNSVRPRVKRPAREIYQVKAVVMSNGLSPTKQGSAESSCKKAKLSDQTNGFAKSEDSLLKNKEDVKSNEVPVAESQRSSRRLLQVRRPSNTPEDKVPSEESSKTIDNSARLSASEGTTTSGLPKSLNGANKRSLLGIRSFIRRRPMRDTARKSERSEPDQDQMSAKKEPKSTALDIFFKVNNQDTKPSFDRSVDESAALRDANDSVLESEGESISLESLSKKHIIEAVENSHEMLTASSSNDSQKDEFSESEVQMDKEIHRIEEDSSAVKTTERSISVEDVDTFLTEGGDFADFDDENEDSVGQTEDIFQEIEEILKS